MTLRLQTFGHLSLIGPNAALAAAPRRKPLALLAVVAAHMPNGLPRERLLVLLWPESTPDRARQALNQSIYTLRTELGVPVIVGTSVLRLHEDIRSDIEHFREALAARDADQALAIASHEFLEGVSFSGCVEFDQWVDATRREIDDALVLLLTARAREATRRGAPDAVDYWRQAAARAPLDPRLAREAAGSMAQAGERVAAFQLLQQHVGLLQRELSLLPDRETLMLLEGLRESTTAESTVSEVPIVLAPVSRRPAASTTPADGTDTVHPEDTSGAPVPQPTPPESTDGQSAPSWARRPARQLTVLIGGVLTAVALTILALRSSSVRDGAPPPVGMRTAEDGAVPPSPRKERLADGNVRAAEFYARALEYLRRGDERLEEARTLLGDAIAADSNFAPALAQYGATQAHLFWIGRDPDRARLRRARELIDRALAIDPLLPQAHMAMAYWLLYDQRAYGLAVAQLDTVLTRSPHDAEALFARGQLQRRQDHWDAAAADLASALDNMPASYLMALELGNTLMLMHRYADARTAIQRAQAIAPDAVDPVAWLAALRIRESGDVATTEQFLRSAQERVDGRALFARMAQTFPEVLRALPHDPFRDVIGVALRDVEGDSAALHLLHAQRLPRSAPVAVLAELDSACDVLEARVRARPAEYESFRSLAELLGRMNYRDSALVMARRASQLMPVTRDAMSGAAALLTLAEAELRAGKLDSARVHVTALLQRPSQLSAAVLRADPLWRPLSTP